MKKTKITSILVSIIILGSIGSVARPTYKNIIVKNKVLLSNINNTTENACVINGNKNLILTNKSGQITSYLSVGEMLNIKSNNGDKSLVTVKETGATGYIDNNNVLNINSGDINNINSMDNQGYIINVSGNVNIRTTPSMDGSVVKVLSNNTKIKIIGKTKQWYKISVDGHKGFIFEEYVAKSATSQKKKDTNTSDSVKGSTKTNKATNHVKTNNVPIQSNDSGQNPKINNKTQSKNTETDNYAYAKTDSGKKLADDIRQAGRLYDNGKYSESQDLCKELLKNKNLDYYNYITVLAKRCTYGYAKTDSGKKLSNDINQAHELYNNGKYLDSAVLTETLLYNEIINKQSPNGQYNEVYMIWAHSLDKLPYNTEKYL